MNKTINVSNVEETIELGKKIGQLLQPGMMITLNGDLGVGKTTFTKGIGQALEINRIINSPTFTILKQYRGKYNLSHFDAYRLEGQDENLGFEEIFDSDDICVVEWPEFIETILPHDRLEITIQRVDDQVRKFELTAIGQRYEDLLGEL